MATPTGSEASSVPVVMMLMPAGRGAVPVLAVVVRFVQVTSETFPFASTWRTPTTFAAPGPSSRRTRVVFEPAGSTPTRDGSQLAGAVLPGAAKTSRPSLAFAFAHT